MSQSDKTTIKIDRSVRDRLSELKWADSMSYNDLLKDMAERYDPPLEAR